MATLDTNLIYHSKFIVNRIYWKRPYGIYNTNMHTGHPTLYSQERKHANKNITHWEQGIRLGSLTWTDSSDDSGSLVSTVDAVTSLGTVLGMATQSKWEADTILINHWNFIVKHTCMLEIGYFKHQSPHCLGSLQNIQHKHACLTPHMVLTGVKACKQLWFYSLRAGDKAQISHLNCIHLRWPGQLTSDFRFYDRHSVSAQWISVFVLCFLPCAAFDDLQINKCYGARSIKIYGTTWWHVYYCTGTNTLGEQQVFTTILVLIL